jgi:two-component system, LytTR family, response regulator
LKLNVAVVDDERPAIEEMEELLGSSGMIGTIRTYMKSREAYDAIVETKPHVAFIDIQMPGMDGLQMAERLQETAPDTDVVFVTAYEQYALKAFDLAAVDYLLKPVSPERLGVTLNRVYDRLAKSGPARPTEAPDLPNGPAAAGVIRCFGRLSVRNAEGQQARWKTAKVEEMFAYLFLHKEVSPERIMNDVFPDSEYDRAKTYIHTCIYQIRKGLAAASLSGSISVHYDRGIYRLETGESTSDLQQLEAVLSNPETGEDSIKSLEAMMGLYEGELFEGLGSLWVTEKREYYRQKYMGVSLSFLDRAAGALSQGKRLEYTRRLHGLDPLNEATALRVTALYRDMGLIREAKDFFNRFRTSYQNELGMELPRQVMNEFSAYLN